MSCLAGCYYCIDSSDYYERFKKRYLPLLNSSAHTTILSTTSRTVLNQTFTNPSDTAPIKECLYTFPLYDGVSVISFTCRVGERLIKGSVKEKLKAKQIFSDAVATGQTAGLLEQSSESSDVFSTRLGNIPAGETVVVNITYVGELKNHDADAIRFTIPTSIAPRYGAGPDTAIHSQIQLKDGQGIKITVDVNMPEGSFINTIQSPSHPIGISMGNTSAAQEREPRMNRASATLSLGSSALEKDFVLIIQSKDVGTPQALLEIHPTIPNHRALVATLVPKFTLPPSRPEIVLVADRSGSMSNNIHMLKSAMNVFVKSIPVGVKFNICSFGSSHRFLWEKSRVYNAATLAEATAHIVTFGADMGGTETFTAIKATIDQRYPDIPLEVVLLTDGDIWSQNQLFEYINQQVDVSEGQIRVFPLGIGSGVSHSLIEGLARAGNGFASAVQEGERLDVSVVKMLRGALSPHITDYSMEVEYENDDDDFELIEKVTESMKLLFSEEKPEQEKPTISLFDTNINPEKDPVKGNDSPYDHLPKFATPKLLQAPNKIPSLFSFSRTSVYILLSPDTIQRKPTKVILRATSAHGPLKLEIPVQQLQKTGETIHQLAAKKAVQDLEEGRGWLYNAKDQDGKFIKERYPSCFQELVENEAVRLGEQFQIAGKWTSFVAVEDGIEQAAKAKRPHAGPRYQSSLAPQYTGHSAPHQTGFSVPRPALYSTTQSSGLMGIPQGIPAGIGGLQEHQQQLMLLEQQNKKRLMMAAAPAPAPLSSGPIQQQLQSHQSQPSYGSGTSSNIFYSNGVSDIDKITQRGEKLDTDLAGRSDGLAEQSRMFYRRARESKSHHLPKIGTGPSNLFGGIQSRSTAPPPIASPLAINSLLSSGPGYASGSATYNGFGGSSPPHQVYFSGNRHAMVSPSMTTPSPVDWHGKSLIDRMHALILLQDFNGSWSQSTDLEGPLGFAIRHIPDASLAQRDDAKKVWTTLLVIAFLEAKLSDEKGAWLLIVEKSHAWLESLGLGDLEALKRQAFNCV